MLATIFSSLPSLSLSSSSLVLLLLLQGVLVAVVVLQRVAANLILVVSLVVVACSSAWHFLQLVQLILDKIKYGIWSLVEQYSKLLC